MKMHPNFIKNQSRNGIEFKLGFWNRYLSDFWRILNQFWVSCGPKMGEVLLLSWAWAAFRNPHDTSTRFFGSRCAQSDAIIASKTFPTNKNRYETIPGATICRFLSIRRALSKADSRPFSSPICILHIKNCFRIGICRTNSTFIRCVSIM